MSRNILTTAVKEKAEQYLGRKFTLQELRLYPYLSYCYLTNGYVGADKLNAEEMRILRALTAEGHIKPVPSCSKFFYKVYPTREFYRFVNDILADSLVTFAEDISPNT